MKRHNPYALLKNTLFTLGEVVDVNQPGHFTRYLSRIFHEKQSDQSNGMWLLV